LYPSFYEGYGIRDEKLFGSGSGIKHTVPITDPQHYFKVPVFGNYFKTPRATKAGQFGIEISQYCCCKKSCSNNQKLCTVPVPVQVPQSYYTKEKPDLANTFALPWPPLFTTKGSNKNEKNNLPTFNIKSQILIHQFSSQTTNFAQLYIFTFFPALL
jgi:hypothetical protein